jgi:hypothetical protein
MPFEPCRYLRYKELYTSELVAASEDGSHIPAIANAWCNLTLKEVGRDDCPVSMIACSRPGRICYRCRLQLNRRPEMGVSPSESTI